MSLPGSIKAAGSPPHLERIAEVIAPNSPIERGSGAEAIAEDFSRLDLLLERKKAGQVIRLWTNSQCLVTTRRFAAMPRFEAAAAASIARGWPVFVRASGGTTVVHRPGMLNVSRFEMARADEIDVARRFRHFADHLIHALRSLGFDAERGAVARSHCDGRFNLTVKGRKIAGTASLFRQRQGWAGLLSHATIWVEGDLRADIAAIVGFERDLGFAADYAVGAHGNLGEWAITP